MFRPREAGHFHKFCINRVFCWLKLSKCPSNACNLKDCNIHIDIRVSCDLSQTPLQRSQKERLIPRNFVGSSELHKSKFVKSEGKESKVDTQSRQKPIKHNNHHDNNYQWSCFHWNWILDSISAEIFRSKYLIFVRESYDLNLNWGVREWRKV